MIGSLRLGATVTIAALGASIVTPGLAAAATAHTTTQLPDSGQLSSSLSDLTGSATSAQAISAALADLNANGLSSSDLTQLDSGLGGVLPSLSTAVSSLLLAGNLNQALGTEVSDLRGLATSSGLSSVRQAAAGELATTLSDVDLSSLLASASAANGSAAAAELSGLTSGAAGSSTSTSSLASLSALLSQLAGESSGSTASTLNSVASLLATGTALDPGTLASAASSLGSIASTATIPGSGGVALDQVTGAITTALSQSSSLLGQLTTVGSSLSTLVDPAQVTTTLGELAQLPLTAPGASSPLSAVAAVLSSVAATPGVTGTPAAAVLSSAASALSNSSGTSATSLLSAISSLESLSSTSLPAPLNTLVANLTTDLASSGSVLGTVSGLSSTATGEVLSELAALSALTRGATIPPLPGVAAVLTQLAGTSPLAGTASATLLNEAASALAAGTETAAALNTTAGLLTSAAGLLPSPLSLTVSNLASALGQSANLVDGTGTGTGGGSTSTSTTGSSSSSTGSSSGTGSSAGAGSGPVFTLLARALGWGVLEHTTRGPNRVRVTLHCYAVGGATCTDTLTATEKGYRRLARTVRLGPDSTRRLTLTLKPTRRTSRSATARKRVRHSARRPGIKLTVKSGSYLVVKQLK